MVQNGGPGLLKIISVELGAVVSPLVPATQVAEPGGSLEPRGLRTVWLHYEQKTKAKTGILFLDEKRLKRHDT
jgi:hypothetical protein